MRIIDGWGWVKLGDVAEVIAGQSPPGSSYNEIGHGTPFFQGKAEFGPHHPTVRKFTTAGTKFAEAGDVLLSVRAPVGPTNVADQHCAIGRGLMAIRAGESADARYLLWAIRARAEALAAQATGSTFVAVTGKQVRELRIPMAPFNEQRRIVDILEDHLSRLDAAEASVSAALRRVAQLKTTFLRVGLRGELVADDTSEGTAHDLVGEAADAFRQNTDDRLWSVPKTWAWVRLGDVFEVNVGATPSRDDSALWSGDLPWVSSGEVAFGRIRSTRERIARTAAGNPDKRIHPPGTVMLAMIGEGRTRGQAAILDIEAAHNQNCASIRVSATAILPEFIYGYLEERYLETRRRGSGGQQPALNRAAIQKFAVPIAPLATQRALADAWDRMAEQVEQLTQALRSTSTRNAGLRRALLSAAFSGKLTGAASDSDRIEELATTI